MRALRLRKLAGVLACIACAVAMGAALWWMGYNSAEVPVAANAVAAQEEDALAAFRTEREQLRAMQKAQLNEIVHDDASEAEIAALAQRRLMELCSREEHERMLEGLLTLRGFDDPVVTVQSESVNVLLRKEVVTQQECSVILDLVCRETGVLSGNVKIIPIK